MENNNNTTVQQIDVISLFTALKRDGRACLKDHVINNSDNKK